jgi:hypothetical protein
MTHVKTASIVIIIAMLFTLTFYYATIMSTVSRARDDTQRALDSFCIENAAVIYRSIKNGSNATTVNEYSNRFRDLVQRELGLRRTGNTLYYENGNREVIFNYNSQLTSSIRNDVLEIKSDFEIVIPVIFAGRKLFDMRVPMQVQSLYVLK